MKGCGDVLIKVNLEYLYSNYLFIIIHVSLFVMISKHSLKGVWTGIGSNCCQNSLCHHLSYHVHAHWPMWHGCTAANEAGNDRVAPNHSTTDGAHQNRTDSLNRRQAWGQQARKKRSHTRMLRTLYTREGRVLRALYTREGRVLRALHTREGRVLRALHTREGRVLRALHTREGRVLRALYTREGRDHH